MKENINALYLSPYNQSIVHRYIKLWMSPPVYV